MSWQESLKKFWNFLKEDTWQSWILSILLIVIGIKFIFFPVVSLITGTSLPLVVVESCSMYHSSNFDSWWQSNGEWYEAKNITKEEFANYPLHQGLNKGDVVIVFGRFVPKKGNIIIFQAATKYPIIHRIVTTNPLSTKGDNGRTNADQLPLEKNIDPNLIVGKAVAKIPYLGWIKLIFFEPFKEPSQRGFCS